MAEVAVWLILLLALVVAGSVVLWRSGRGRYRPPSFVLATATVLVQIAASMLIVVGAWWASGRYAPAWYTPVLAATLSCVVVWFVLLMGVLRFSFAETTRAAIALGFATVCVAGFGMIPLLVIYRTYRIPTGAMAPTLCGPHASGRCSTCGAATVVSLRENSQDGTRATAEIGICSRCFRVEPPVSVGSQPIDGDRILVRRFATPKRWDLVVFVYPHDPSQIYVKRLVGLPGESVEVKDGGIWINGKRLEPPPEIAGLRWFRGDEPGMTPEFSNEGNPMRMAKNEYFVLGDFSPRSFDSRYWGALPASDLRGVVAAIYWPPRSRRVLPAH